MKHSLVFVYVSFFCDKRWRIMTEKANQGYDFLETVVEERLVSIGRCLALLDWMIYEQ